jgi:tRNA nucleotidyltransferase (CCA-adding enzyme)
VALLRQVCERWRVPAACRELAEVVAREHGNVHRSETLNAAAVMRLLERCDALRRPDRFEQMLLACECDARGRLGLQDRPYPQAERLRAALKRAQAVDASAVVEAALSKGMSGPAVGDAVRRARVDAIAEGLAPLSS